MKLDVEPAINEGVGQSQVAIERRDTVAYLTLGAILNNRSVTPRTDAAKNTPRCLRPKRMTAASRTRLSPDQVVGDSDGYPANTVKLPTVTEGPDTLQNRPLPYCSDFHLDSQQQ